MCLILLYSAHFLDILCLQSIKEDAIEGHALPKDVLYKTSTRQEIETADN